MIQVIPDSHYWTDVNQLIVTIESEIYRKKNKNNPNMIIIDNYDGKSFEEHLLIGLKNTKSHGYNLSRNIRENMIPLSELGTWVKFKIQNDDFDDDENYLYLIDKTDYDYIIINEKTKKTIRISRQEDLNVILIK